MKRIAIIAAIILSTAITAFSLSIKINKIADSKVEDIAVKTAAKSINKVLATAD